MSETLAVLAACVGALLVVNFLLIHWPRRGKELQHAQLRRFFHGLILFGREGARVVIDGSQPWPAVTFRKHYLDDQEWEFWVQVEGEVPASFGEGVTDGVRLLGSNFEWEEAAQQLAGAAYVLAGPGLRDPDALEGVAKLIIRCLRHPAELRYRVDFQGDKDVSAARAYFGLKR